jgi:hypothetical protein
MRSLRFDAIFFAIARHRSGIAVEDAPRSYNRVEPQSSDKKSAHPEPVTFQAVAGDQTPRRFFLLLASFSGGFVLIADSSTI